MYDHVQVSFKTYYHTESSDHVVAVVGSSLFLGSWNPAKSLILTEDMETGIWQVRTRLQAGGSSEWKFAVLDRRNDRIVTWEDGKNRVLSIGKLPLEIEAPWNGTEQITYQQPSVTDTKLINQPSTDGVSIRSLQSASSSISGDITVLVTFKIRFVPDTYNESVAVSGSNENLGAWNPERAIFCEPFGSDNCWTGSVTMPGNARYEWKLVCLDKQSHRIIRWENCDNRLLYVERSQLEVVAPWNVKDVVRYARQPSVIITPLEKKSSDLDCTDHLSRNNNSHEHSEDDTRANVNFVVEYNSGNADTTLCVAGSCESLGNWKLENALVLRQNKNGAEWQGTIFVPQYSAFEWKLLMIHLGVTIWEPHVNRFLQLKSSNVDVYVAWNDKEQIEPLPMSMRDLVAVTFKTCYQLNEDEVIAVSGNSASLGAWNGKEAMVLDNQHNTNCWNSKQVFLVDEILEYKLAVLDKHSREVRRWEERPNRMLYIGKSSLEVVLPWGSREIIREVYPRQGEPGAEINMRSCLQQCFNLCCTGKCDHNGDEHSDQSCIDIEKTKCLTQSTVNVMFSTNYVTPNENHVLALTGSCDSLGAWDLGRASQFERVSEPGSWQLMKSLPINIHIEWKLMIMDKLSQQVIRWEERKNRIIVIKRSHLEVNACWDAVATVEHRDGCLIPIYSCGSCDADVDEPCDCDEELLAATITTQYFCNDNDCVVAVSGSTRDLGQWRPERAVLMESQDYSGYTWTAVVRLPLNTDISWKLVLLERGTSRVIRWEEMDNRRLRLVQNDLRIDVPWNAQETTSEVRPSECCSNEASECELRSVMKPSCGPLNHRKKSVHFPADPVAECRVFVKNKCVTRCLSENCHRNTQTATPHECDQNNNSLVQCCRFCVAMVFVWVCAVLNL